MPLSRIGDINWSEGRNQKIELLSGCEIKIDSDEGLIEIMSKNKEKIR